MLISFAELSTEPDQETEPLAEHADLPLDARTLDRVSPAEAKGKEGERPARCPEPK